MTPLGSSSAKNTNPVRKVRVSLYLGSKLVTTVAVEKRAKDEKSLTQEVVYWAKQFGLTAAKPEAAKAAKAEKEPKTTPQVQTGVQDQTGAQGA
jgi:hypothetical protein